MHKAAFCISHRPHSGKKLAAILGVPLVSIDTLAIDPGFVVHPMPVFHARLRAALDAAPNGWVVDGKNTYSGAEMAFAGGDGPHLSVRAFARVHSDTADD